MEEEKEDGGISVLQGKNEHWNQVGVGDGGFDLGKVEDDKVNLQRILQAEGKDEARDINVDEKLLPSKEVKLRTKSEFVPAVAVEFVIKGHRKGEDEFGADDEWVEVFKERQGRVRDQERD